jgi:hypothetical protein
MDDVKDTAVISRTAAASTSSKKETQIEVLNPGAAVSECF